MDLSMYLHAFVPDFMAAVHQALVARWRGQAVAVALDTSPHAPLLALSREARAAGVHAGLRAAAAHRRCRSLVITTPEPDWYQRAHTALLTLVETATPRVGGMPGRYDADLAGTAHLWSAATAAERLRVQARTQLHLELRCGVAARLVLARLAACSGRAIENAESTWCDPLPLTALDDLAPAARATLAQCAVTTIGQARELGAAALQRLLGVAATPLTILFDAESDLPFPAREGGRSEPTVHAERHCTHADARQVEGLLDDLARDIGYQLRRRSLAATVLLLAGRHVDGRLAQAQQQARRQLVHDADIAAQAHALGHRLARRVAWERLRLTASGLAPVQAQEQWSGPQRSQQVEAAQDRLRRRFGSDLVRRGVTR